MELFKSRDCFPVYIHPNLRAAYIIGFNTFGSDKKQNTKALDSKIKEYLFKNIFPLIGKSR